MKRRILLCAFLVFVLTCSASVLSQAQAPSTSNLRTSFTYQGQVKRNGQPISGACDFRFTLWDAAEVGAQVGPAVNKDAVLVTKGLFTVALDFGTAAFAGDARWLGIEVRCPAGGGDFTPLAPRQALTPTPYSLFADSAPWLGLVGVPADLADGDSDTLASLSCAAGQVAKWTGAEWVCANDEGGPGGIVYTAGPGLILVENRFSVAFAGTGTANSVARSDHNHDAAYVNEGQPDSITSGMLVGGAVTSAKLADNAITAEKLADGAALAQILDDDGTGSGLDADLLDGRDSTYFAAASHQHDGQYWSLTGNADTNSVSNFVGTTDAVSLTLAVNGTAALRLEPTGGTPNVIGGDASNYATAGVQGVSIGGGGGTAIAVDYYGPNRVTDHYGTVGGGLANVAGGSGPFLVNHGGATVSGGYGNSATGDTSAVGGGIANTASGPWSAVGGGGHNIADFTYATVAGGGFNNSGGEGATVAGGARNLATADFAAIGGGVENSVTEWAATLGGGEGNTAEGQFSTVAGGYHNVAGGVNSSIGGGSSNSASYIGTTVSGGTENSAQFPYATISGGESNTAGGQYATVAGGTSNTSSNDWATVGGGQSNTASGSSATASGGRGNAATGGATFVGGGAGNTASGSGSVVVGGTVNAASGWYSAIPGGSYNAAEGDYSVAAGSKAQASLYGQAAFAGGSFGGVGTAQASLYVLRASTSNSTPTELFLDGSSRRLAVARGRALNFEIQVIASDNIHIAGYRAEGVIVNPAGTTRFVGTPTVTTLGEDVAQWDVAVAADDVNDALIIRVTGSAGMNIRWVATVRTAEVAW